MGPKSCSPDSAINSKTMNPYIQFFDPLELVLQVLQLLQVLFVIAFSSITILFRIYILFVGFCEQDATYFLVRILTLSSCRIFTSKVPIIQEITEKILVN